MARTPRSPCEDDKQENKGGNDDTERSSVLLAALILTIAHMMLPLDIEKNATVRMMVPDVSSPNRSWFVARAHAGQPYRAEGVPCRQFGTYCRHSSRRVLLAAAFVPFVT